MASGIDSLKKGIRQLNRKVRSISYAGSRSRMCLKTSCIRGGGGGMRGMVTSLMLFPRLLGYMHSYMCESTLMFWVNCH